MWNSFNTDDYNGMISETIRFKAHEGRMIHAYHSRPLGKEKFASIVLIPHMPGWDEFCREAARRFTEHGYAVLCPDIYADYGSGTPTEVSTRMREEGGVSDKSVMEDVQESIDYLRAQQGSNGKVGVIGMCSGGRHSFLAACTLEGIDAAVDCWGGQVIAKEEELDEKRPVAPIDYAEKLSCPLLGIFGNDDRFPPKEDVDKTEEILKKLGKQYEFYRYDDAGHGIWYYDKPMYRQEQAMDSWNKTLEFFDRYLK